MNKLALLSGVVGRCYSQENGKRPCCLCDSSANNLFPLPQVVILMIHVLVDLVTPMCMWVTVTAHQ